MGIKKELVVGLIIAVVGGAILQVSTGALSNIGNQLNDLINPSPVLNTTIVRVTDANDKDIEDGNSTKSTTVKVYFKGYKNNDEDKSLTFKCQMDSESSSSCSNGQVFPNLKIAHHSLSVQAIGKDGLEDTSPDIFSFNIITSASIEGKVVTNLTGKPQSNVNVYLNTTKNQTTDVDGSFIMDDVPDGSHRYKVVNQKDDLLTCGVKKVPVATTAMSWTISLTGKPNRTEIPESSSCKYEFRPSISPANYEITLNQIGVRLPKALQSPNPLDPLRYNITLWVDGPEPILERIANVTYFLHATTFNPSVTSSNNPNTKFALSFTAWGMFDLKAKVYFKDVRDIQDLELLRDDWKFRPPNVS